jgi:hypothetical protein
MSEHPQNNQSRRSMLRKAASMAGLAAVSAVALSRKAVAATYGTMAKSAVAYQDKPKGSQRCDNCALYIPGASKTANGHCKAVAGSIAPQAWCSIWSAKS